MVEVMQAFATTINKFVVMLFNLHLGDGISVGVFMLSVAILGVVIGIIFGLISVPGRKWAERLKFKSSEE